MAVRAYFRIVSPAKRQYLPYPTSRASMSLSAPVMGSKSFSKNVTFRWRNVSFSSRPPVNRIACVKRAGFASFASNSS